jgi:hypothetical protein
MGAFYYDQSMPVRILLTPYEIPYLIEETGGTFDFTIRMTNIDTAPQTVTAWCDLTLPDSIIICPMIGPVTLTINPSTTIERERTQTVPGNASFGVYHYNAYAVVGADTSKDSFMFGKLGTVLDGSYDGWGNCGEMLDSRGSSRTAHQAIPSKFTLHQNYPNPFNASTTIRFDLPEACPVSLEIFDINGRFVESPLHHSWREAGQHEITFDASELPSGVYVYRLETGDFVSSAKMVLIK